MSQRAAGTAQTRQRSTRPKCCQTYDTMEVPPHMLRFLRIRNLAVIEAVEVEFEPGFNVLTGETGAGKSILVEAVGLLLGARASPDLVRTGEAQATIEAIFERVRATAASWSSAARSPRRAAADPSSTARSPPPARCAISSARLVELHGQHEHQALLDPLTHLPLLDHLRRARGARRRSVAAAWTDVRSLREQLERSRMDAREKAARLDLIAFQLGEIEKAAPKPGEDEELGSDAAGAGQRGARSAAVRGRLRRTLRAATRRCWPDSAASGSASASWRPSTRSSRPYLDARDGIKSQLEDLAFFLRQLRRRRRRVAGAAAAGRGPTGAARTSEAEARPGAAGRDRQGAGARARAGPARRREKRADELRAGARRGDRRPSSSARASSRGGAAHAAVAFARELEALLAELAMARTRFEVRFNDGRARPGARGASAASTRRSSSSRRILARISGRSRASSPAASCRA